MSKPDWRDRNPASDSKQDFFIGGRLQGSIVYDPRSGWWTAYVAGRDLGAFRKQNTARLVVETAAWSA